MTMTMLLCCAGALTARAVTMTTATAPDIPAAPGRGPVQAPGAPFLRPGAPVSSTRPADGQPRGPVQVARGTEVWTEAPPSVPPGAKMAVLEGNPRAPGIFTIRMKVPAGYRLPVHTHPADERVTVISGSVHVGFGDAFDPASPTVRTFPAGSFYVNPPAVRHYLWFDEQAVLQITGFGPWEVVYADPASDPRRGTSGTPAPTPSSARPPAVPAVSAPGTPPR